MRVWVVAILIAIHFHSSLSDHKDITFQSSKTSEIYDSTRDHIISKDYKEDIYNNRVLKTIKINNLESDSHLKNHQVRVDLNKGNFNFERVHPKGYDLYFKDSQDNILPHWIELYDPAQHQALLWVKVHDIPSRTISTVNLFQGMPDSNRSNGDDTYDFFDDFDTLSTAWVEQGPVLTPTQPWEGNMIRDPTVLFQDNQYHMWYWNAGSDIGYAVSSDGVNWTKYEANPVFTNALRPSVVYNEGTYYLFYAQTGEHGIGLATSSDPTGPFADRGLVLSPSQDWEKGLIRGPSAWYDTEEKNFKLWYSAGYITPAGVPWTEPAAIGYATSQDGYNWTKPLNNSIMQGRNDGSWLGQAIETLRVYKKDGTYYGFFHSADYWGISRIGLTLSSNGYDWNPQPEDLIVDLGGYGDFDCDFLYTTAPIYNDGWMFWHNGRNNDNANPEIIGLVKLESNVSQLDSSKWAKSRRVTVSVENSTASFKMFDSTQEYDQHDYFIWTAEQFQDGILEARVQMPSGYTDLYSLIAIGSRFNGTYHNILINGDPAYYGDMSWYELLIGAGTVLSDTVRTGRWNNAQEYVFLPYYGQTIKRDQWYTLRLEVNGQNISSYIDDQQVFSGQDSSLTKQGSLILRILETDGLVDWVRFRKSGSENLKATVEDSKIIV